MMCKFYGMVPQNIYDMKYKDYALLFSYMEATHDAERDAAKQNS